MKSFITYLIITFASLFLYSCGNGEQATQNQTPGLNQSGPEYTSQYICPMRCPKSGSDKMGTCPVCHMDYVENKEHKDFGKS